MIIIFLLLFAFSANAETVQATGYGNDKKTALEDAKTKAVEMVAGSWVDSSKKSVNGSLNQEIRQFTSGIVESYKIVNETNESVTIEANVVARKDNSINSSTLQVNPDQLADSFKNMENEEEAGIELDTLTRAIEVKVTSIKPLEKEKNLYYVKVFADYSYSKKWLNDYKEFSKLNKNYKFITLDCGHIIAFAEFDFGDRKELIPSYQPVFLEEEKTSDNLKLGATGVIEPIYTLKSVEGIKGVRVALKCKNEDYRYLLNK